MTTEVSFSSSHPEKRLVNNYLLFQLLLVLLLSFFAGNVLAAFQQDDSTSQGFVVAEAENFHSNIPQGSHSWSQVFTPVGFSGTGAMRSLPNNGTKVTSNYAANSPRLDYQIDFVTSGLHYVWVRGAGNGGGSNSVHAGLDNQEITTSNGISVPKKTYGWTSDSFTVATSGAHTLNIWMREDGTVVDKVLLTTDASFVPSGIGPPESPQGGLPTVATPTIAPMGGSFTDSVTVTLASATQNALLYYTDDGSDPTVADMLYSSPFALTTSATLKVIGILASHNDSAIASASFTITPGGGNAPPVLDPIGNRSVEEGQTLSFTVTASDPDTTIPDLPQPTNLPTGASFTDNNDGTGDFVWATQVGDANTYPNIIFTAVDATDPGLTDSETISITVNAPGGGNAPPVLDPIGNRSVEEGQTLSFTVTASDPDTTIPDLPQPTNLPTGASFTDNNDGTGDFVWATQVGDANTYPNIIFTAVDATDPGLTDSETISITVNAPGGGNAPPVLDPIGNRSVEEGQTLSFTVTASDPDTTIPDLPQPTNLPTGASFTDNNDGTGDFVWATQVGDANTYPNIIFTAVDATDPGLTDSETISITVNAPGGGNAPPVLDPIGNRSVEEGQTLSFTVTASDPDTTIPDLPQPTNLPTGASFTDNNDGTGDFVWATQVGDANTYPNIIFTAVDATDPGLTDSETISITVNAPGGGNAPPVLDPIGNRSVEEGQTLSFTVTASDPDTTIPDLPQPTNLPTGASFTDNNDGTGDFVWATQVGDANTYPNIIFTAVDATDPGLTDSETISITVNAPGGGNAPPVLDPIGNRSVEEGQTLSFTVTASDPDTTIPDLPQPTNLPTGASFTDNNDGTGDFVWATQVGDANTYPNIIFTARDSLFAGNDMPFIIAHRGGTGVTPENTLAAFGSALSLGVNIEMDVHLTSDDVIVVIHDSTVDRTTDGTGAVAGKTLAEIKTLDAGSYLSPAFAGEQIPTLDEVFTLFNANAPTNAIISIDTKVENAVMYQKLVELLNTHNLFDRTFIEVSNASIADEIELLDSRVRFAFWMPTVFGLNSALNTAHFERIHTRSSLAHWADAAHAAGKTFIPYINTEQEWQQAKQYNIDGINTDFPFAMNQVINTSALSDSETVTVTVNAITQPILNPIGNRSVEEGQTLSFTVSASDPDATIPDLPQPTNLPTGASFTDNNDGTGDFVWATQVGDANTYSEITFTAEDANNSSFTDSETITITVNTLGSGIGVPPILDPIGNRSVEEGQTLSFTVSASDPDATIPDLPQPTNLPTDTSFTDNNDGTGDFVWATQVGDVNSYPNITFTAVDANEVSQTDSETITIFVNAIVAPPVLNSIGNRSVEEGQTLSFTVSASDPDATIPDLPQPTNLPTGASFTDNNDGTGDFVWATQVGDANTYPNIIFTAVDATDPGLTDSETISITVNAVGGGAGNFTRGNQTAKLFGVHEIILTGDGLVDNPFLTNAMVTFVPISQQANQVSVKAFYDGGNTWRARVYITETGVWNWSSSSDDIGLDLQSGTFIAEGSNLRGMLRKHPQNIRQWMTDDGQTFLNLTDTAYRLFNQTVSTSDFEDYVNDDIALGITALRAGGCGGWTKWKPGGPKSNWCWDGVDLDQYDLQRFQTTDTRLEWLLNNHPDIYIQLIQFGKSKDVGTLWKAITQSRRDAIMDYQIARWGAWPQLYFQIVNDTAYQGRPDNEDMVREIGLYYAAHDPWNHLISAGPKRREPSPFVLPSDFSDWHSYLHIEKFSEIDATVVDEYVQHPVHVYYGEDWYEQWGRNGNEPVNPTYYYRRMFWSVLLSGGSPNYGGRYQVIHPYTQTGSRPYQATSSVTFTEPLIGLDSIQFIRQFLTGHGIDLAEFVPIDSAVRDPDPPLPEGNQGPSRLQAAHRSFDEFIIYLTNAADGEKSGGGEFSNEAQSRVQAGLNPLKTPQVEIDLRTVNPSTTYDVIWHRPNDGIEIIGSDVNGGDWRTLVSPWEGSDAILYLNKQ